VRGGSKDNRKKQVSRIIEFLDWAESTENVRSLHGLGRKHVIGFWKSHRDFSEETAYKYWLGISELWERIGKHEDPPKPFKVSADQISEELNNSTIFSEFSQAISVARNTKNLSVQQIANMSGCEVMIINELETGQYDNATISDAQNLLRILNIKFLIEQSS
jgi:hypothetical protein